MNDSAAYAEGDRVVSPRHGMAGTVLISTTRQTDGRPVFLVRYDTDGSYTREEWASVLVPEGSPVSDSVKVAAHLDALTFGRIISDACARVIASQHSDGHDALQCLATTGAVVAGIDSALAECLSVADRERQRADWWALTRLIEYVADRRRRRDLLTVAGWSGLRL